MRHVQTDSVPAARDGGQSRTKVVVALIGAAATVIAAFAAHLSGGGGGGHPPTKVASVQELSRGAAAWVDEKTEECNAGGPVSPTNRWVAITSPASGAEVGDKEPVVKVPVEGTAELLEGNHLYLFSYAPAVCKYYFNPSERLQVVDGRWNRKVELVESRGAMISLIAVVVNDKTDAEFKEIIRFHDGDYLRRLPKDAPRAKIEVNVRP